MEAYALVGFYIVIVPMIMGVGYGAIASIITHNDE